MSLQRRIFLMVVGLLLVVLLPTIAIFTLNTRNALFQQAKANGQLIAELLASSTGFIESIPVQAEAFISDQMVVQARIAAHLVAIAEAAGLSPDEINAHLRDIVNTTVLDEFWITDENGYAYLRSDPSIEFTFNPDPEIQPQAYIFWQLLSGAVDQVIQEAQVREVDDQTFKYVGVAGIDKPRIVQVGYNIGVLDILIDQVGLPNLVQRLINERSVSAIWIVDNNLNLLASDGISSPDIDINFDPSDRETVQQVLQTGESLQYTQDGFLHVVTPVINNEQIIGAVLVYVSLEGVQNAIQQALIFAVLLSLIAVGTGAIASQLLSRWISQPILHLSQAAEAIANGEWDYDIPLTRNDEVGTLARTFSAMSARIRDLINQFEERVADRTRDLQMATASSAQLVSELQLAYTVGRKITETYNMPDYQQRIMSVIAQSFDLYTVLLFEPDKDHKRLILRAAADRQGVSIMPEIFPEIDLDANSTVALAARMRETVAVNDVTKSNVYMPIDALPATSAEIAIPLVIGGELIGVLDLQSENVNVFDNNMLRFMENIAALVTLSIKNAHLKQHVSNAQAEIEVIRKNQAQFISQLSRDVRLPLYDLLDTTEIVADGFMGEITPEQAKSLHQVVDKGDELLSNLNEALGISRIVVDGLPLYVENINLRHSLEPIIAITRDLVKNRPIEIVVDMPESLPELYGDDRRIRQIFLGLLSNAAKFTEQGHITIQIEQQADKIHAVIQDTGRGISQEEQQQLFSMALVSQQEVKGASRALRLPLTRKFIEAHGGKIWLESTPGVGTTCHVTLLVATP
ncbi:MAG: HAMP domain-containing protein [Chloroflexi bacterium]|nr:MAG: HAMP domain-containing protein [Chloroflexota bacterium]